MDIHGVDPEFLSKFEEEFKEYQDSAEKTKASRRKRRRGRGSQTPPPRRSSRKRPRPHSSTKEKAPSGLPSVAWESPSKPPEDEPEFERLDEITLRVLKPIDPVAPSIEIFFIIYT